MFSPSKNPTFKLYYFNIRALAEPIRFLLAYGGLAYEDVRIEKEDWPKLKPSKLEFDQLFEVTILNDILVLAMPMEQMPVLEVDGQRVHQSVAIGRYLAKRVGLAGSNDWESLQIDSAVDTVNELRQSKSISFIFRMNIK